MYTNALIGLPLVTLYELMVPAIQELLTALESEQEGAIKAKKKHCEQILEAIASIKQTNPMVRG